MMALFAPSVEDRGLRLVCVRVFAENNQPVVQVMAEDPQTRGLSVEHCARISRELSALLDVEDLVKDAYRLEVSSPGIDRPLISLQDFADFAGFEAKVEIAPPLNGQKRFRGRLAGTEGDQILITTDEGPASLPFAALVKAKLMLTDDLIKAGERKKNDDVHV